MTVEPVDYYCPVCDSVLLATRCKALLCNGYRCYICNTGCDWPTETGLCLASLHPFPNCYVPGGERW